MVDVNKLFTKFSNKTLMNTGEDVLIKEPCTWI